MTEIDIININPLNNKDLIFIKNTYKFINKATKSIENFHFNLAIAAIRSLFNEINNYQTVSKNCLIFKKFSISQLIILLSPICPHISEEAWLLIGNTNRLSEEKWPTIVTKYLQQDKLTIPIQVDGKKRGEILVETDISKDEIKKLALSEKNIKKFVTQEPKKIIIVPNRIINIVT